MKRYRAELFSVPLGIWVEHWQSCEKREYAEENGKNITKACPHIYSKARVKEFEVKEV